MVMMGIHIQFLLIMLLRWKDLFHGAKSGHKIDAIKNLIVIS